MAAADSMRASGRNPYVGAAIRDVQVPRWGSALQGAAQRNFLARMQVYCHGTSLPVESNNVTLDPELKDAWGMPAIRVTYKDHPRRSGQRTFPAGSRRRDHRGGGRAQSHESAGDRAAVLDAPARHVPHGQRPANSVVDKYHRSHDMPNLFVCDGSSLVTSGRGQPTMTIQALAFRAGEHIARFAKRGEV